jgi:DnaJ-class molecular chaperone
MMSGYKTYDPTLEGYGSEAEWSRTFHESLGFEEAEAIINDGSPRDILGVGKNDHWDLVKKAYRKKVMEVHPDRCILNGMTLSAATEAFKKVQAAYAVLKREYGM